MSEKRKYDSTVARIAGNLLSGTPSVWRHRGAIRGNGIRAAVAAAREIVAEVERTEEIAETLNVNAKSPALDTRSDPDGR